MVGDEQQRAVSLEVGHADEMGREPRTGGPVHYSLLPTPDGNLGIAAIVPDAVMRLHNGRLINYKLPAGCIELT